MAGEAQLPVKHQFINGPLDGYRGNDLLEGGTFGDGVEFQLMYRYPGKSDWKTCKYKHLGNGLWGIVTGKRTVDKLMLYR